MIRGKMRIQIINPWLVGHPDHADLIRREESIKTTTLLCVDGCEQQQVLYEQELGSEGYKVITAADGREALDKVQWLYPDIIIMDPQTGGLEAIGRIIGKNRSSPIIIHTTCGNQREDFLSWAVDAVIARSTDLTALKSKIRELLTEEPAFVYNETADTIHEP
ncbi:MAG: response regulator [Candidatus Scalindua sp.]|nr:response regulator [Candidatus Scalindua sp.]